MIFGQNLSICGARVVCSNGIKPFRSNSQIQLTLKPCVSSFVVIYSCIDHNYNNLFMNISLLSEICQQISLHREISVELTQFCRVFKIRSFYFFESSLRYPINCVKRQINLLVNSIRNPEECTAIINEFSRLFTIKG